MLIALLMGCTGSLPSEVVVWDDVPTGTVLQPVSTEGFTSLSPLQTDIGDGHRGAALLGFGTASRLTPGPPLHVNHAVIDGVAVPTDEQALVFASYAHHALTLAPLLEPYGLAEAGDSLFPVSGLIWLAPTYDDNPLGGIENASFAGSDRGGFLMIYPDASTGVPLGAQAGIVYHEIGHGLLHELAPGLSGDYRGVHEGFADLVSILIRDDPRSISLPGRDASERRTPGGFSLFGSNDSAHDRGAVLASFGWYVRQELGDPVETLRLLVETVPEWQERYQGEELDDPDWVLGGMFAARVAQSHPDLVRVCREYNTRFGFDPCSP